MSSFQRMVDVAEHRTEEVLVVWRRLMRQCDDARQKLLLLKQHGQRYRDRMTTHLQQGMPATSTRAFMGFIAQIEEVVARQEDEVSRLDEACKRQWQAYVEARRERRVYEILRDRHDARQIEAALRRSQAEVDELLQRVIKSL